MLIFALFLEEIIKRGNTHFREEFEGHGPHDSGKCDDEEVSDAACYELVAEEGDEGLRESRLDAEDDGEAYRRLDDLCIPGGICLELGIMLIDKINGQKAEGAGEERCAVLSRAIEIVGIYALLGNEECIKQKSYGKSDGDCRNDRHILVESLLGGEYGIKDEEHCRRNEKRNADVGRGMNAEVHTRECHKNDDNDAYYREPAALRGRADSTEGACDVLCMSRGEGVACGLLYRAINYGEAGILYPRARHLTNKLERLIDNSADKSRDKDVVASVLIHTPEEDYREGEEDSFLTEMGDRREDKIKDRISDLFKQI